MFDWVGKYVSIGKVKTVHIFAVFLASCLLLFSPPWILIRLNLNKTIDEFGSTLGSVCVLSASVLLSRALMLPLKFSSDKVRGWFLLKAYKKRLHDLTQEEKEILRHYIGNETRTAYLHFNNGTTSSLESNKIIYRASTVSVRGAEFPYNIQPWAFDYLRKHPELLFDRPNECRLEEEVY